MMHRSLVVASTLAIAWLALASRPVAAQPGAAAPAAGQPNSAPQQATGDTDTGVTVEDPRGDHGLVAHTALTQPKGRYVVHDRFILLPGITYGLTDRAQISVTMLALPILFACGEAKIRVLDRGNFHLALDSNVAILADGYDTLGLMGLFGATATRCFDARCRYSLSGSLMAGGLRAAGTDNGVDVLYAAAGLATRLRPGVKTLFEVQSVLARDVGESASGGWDRGLTLMAGVRLYKSRFAIDLAVLSAAGRSDSSDIWSVMNPPVVGPWINLAYRAE